MQDQSLSIVRRFADGDATATQEVRARVRRIAASRGFGMSNEDRVDIEQSVTLQLWRYVNRPDFEAAGFWGLVEVVTARRCIDWLRGQRPATDLEAVSPLVDRGPDPLREVLGRERQELAEKALDRLPGGCRALIEMHTAQGMTYSQIARELGRSEGALRVQMHRCIKLAAQELKNLVLERKAGTNQEKE